MMGKFEVELRGYITPEKYSELLTFFKTQSKMFSSDDQVTYYFDAPIDIRLQQNLHGSKIWMKKGEMHSSAREEVEVHFGKEDFDSLKSMFLMLGYNVKVKWFRKRHSFMWKGFEVCLDSNRGFGHVIEIEKKSDALGKTDALLEIEAVFKELDVSVTPQEEQKQKYEHYVANWQELTK